LGAGEGTGGKVAGKGADDQVQEAGVGEKEGTSGGPEPMQAEGGESAEQQQARAAEAELARQSARDQVRLACAWQLGFYTPSMMGWAVPSPL